MYKFPDVGVLSLTVLECNQSPSLSQICNWYVIIRHKSYNSTRLVQQIPQPLPLAQSRLDALFIVIGIWFGQHRILPFSVKRSGSASAFYVMHVTNTTIMSCMTPTACQNKYSIKKAAYFNVGHLPKTTATNHKQCWPE